MTLRIISGNLKGRKLFSVRGMATRPSAERLREAVFNILARRIEKTRVLDLFAGTGALGIEALSRGAEFSVFIENSAPAISVITRNIRLCGIESQTKVFRWDAAKNLNCIRNIVPKFNLVFMDPPYEKNLIGPAVRNLISGDALENDALIVIEHSTRDNISETVKGITLSDQRKYGRSVVSFFRYDADVVNLLIVSK